MEPARETNRNKNIAYICYQQEEPYWATNLEIKLDRIEKVMGCKFEDGRHPFVRVFFYDREENYLIFGEQK